ncbi:MAG: hypothetical protein HQL72_14660 [Magnetococcales bacterium]|nr:hypothetical protein [Magnetococcales bacterium]
MTEKNPATCHNTAQVPGTLYGGKKQATAILSAQAIEHRFYGINTACQPRFNHKQGYKFVGLLLRG